MPADDAEFPQTSKKFAHSTEDCTSEHLSTTPSEDSEGKPYTHDDDVVPEDDNSISSFSLMQTPSPVNRFEDDENAPPGASMFKEKPIEVSLYMQDVVSKNSDAFEHPYWAHYIH